MNITGMSYLPLGEKRIVKAQIENRSKIDPLIPCHDFNGDINSSAGAPRLSEDVIVTYVSLDKQIDECGQSEKESLVVHELMQGYGISDIAEHYGLQKTTCSTLFSRAQDKITSWHDEILFYTLHHNLA